MVAPVLADDQICGLIIVSNPVYVVDLCVGRQNTPKGSLRDSDVFAS
jgi:hypothetical protein